MGSRKAVIYTDGSYDSLSNTYGYGVVLEADGKVFHAFGGAEDRTGGWQVNGELEAAIRGVKEAVRMGCTHVEVRYDYMGVEMWATGRWRAKKPFTQKYRADMRALMAKISVSFRHVKGHSGNAGNEDADSLAKLGASGCTQGFTETAKPRPAADAHGEDGMRRDAVACGGDLREPGSPLPKKKGRAPELIHEDGTIDCQAVRECIKPACADGIRRLHKLKKPSFKDFMNLKVGGADRLSRVKPERLAAYAQNEGKQGYLEDAFPDGEGIMQSIRWQLRGLTWDEAVHKTKVDLEVASNCW